MFFSAFACCW
jgi:hypothetical protein